MYYGNGTQRYRETDIGTMSPGKIVVMLYERVVRDLEQARDALERGDRGTVNRLVVHSQTIISELRGALNHGAGGEVSANLDALYEWLFHEHLTLLSDPEAGRIDDCLKVVAPLLDAWRQVQSGGADAARSLAAAASGPDPARDHGDRGGRRDAEPARPATDRGLLSVTV